MEKPPINYFLSEGIIFIQILLEIELKNIRKSFCDETDGIRVFFALRYFVIFFLIFTLSSSGFWSKNYFFIPGQQRTGEEAAGGQGAHRVPVVLRQPSGRVARLPQRILRTLRGTAVAIRGLAKHCEKYI